VRTRSETRHPNPSTIIDRFGFDTALLLSNIAGGKKEKFKKKKKKQQQQQHLHKPLKLSLKGALHPTPAKISTMCYIRKAL